MRVRDYFSLVLILVGVSACGRSTVTCQTHVDCSSGNVCIEGRCVDGPACVEGFCPSGTECLAGVCVPGALVPDRCDDGGACPEGLQCIDERCEPVCTGDDCVSECDGGPCPDTGSVVWLMASVLKVKFVKTVHVLRDVATTLVAQMETGCDVDNLTCIPGCQCDTGLVCGADGGFALNASMLQIV